MTFSVTDLSPRIGCAIAAEKPALLAGEYAADIRDLLERRGVILFRGFDLTDEEQVALARTLGRIEQALYKVSFDPEHNPDFAAYTRGTFSWHMDRIDLDVPPLGSILTARVLSPTGGETEFANTYAAYEDLPAEYQAYLDTLTVVHTIEASYREIVDKSEELMAFARKFPPKRQPLVWKHRSGRKSLALGVHACQVVGMNQEASDKLLEDLMTWATQPQYVCRHAWQRGDTVMWDNTGTMHRVTAFDETCGRRLHRTTLLGEEPLVAAA
jgi:alpha-ketoglutarate-dependent taurine dioxygenase